HFDRAIELDSGYALAHAALGAIYAIRYLARTEPDDLNRAVASLERALELDPELGEPYSWLCYAYARQGKLDLIEQTGRKAVERQPDLYRSHYLLGVARLLASEARPELFDSAAECFRKSRQAEPKFEGSYLFLGWMACCTGEYDAAEQWCTRAMAMLREKGLVGWMPGAETILGTIRLRRLDFDGAAAACDDALGFLAQSEHVLREAFRALAACVRGDALLRRGDAHGALEDYRYALQVSCDSPRVMGMNRVTTRALAGMASAHVGLGESEHAAAWEQSRESLDRILADPRSWLWEASAPEICYALATAAVRRDQCEEALHLLETAERSGWRDARWLEIDPELAPLRREARLAGIVERLRKKSPLRLEMSRA
ncbi:MAG: hypothetical protein ACREF4_21325, partial [Gammaproteobacteria bacterium]